MANTAIIVERLTRLTNAGNLKAFASIAIGDTGWKIHDIRVVQQSGQKAWVSLPQSSYEKNGQKKWYPIIEAPERILEEIRKAVLAMYEVG